MNLSFVSARTGNKHVLLSTEARRCVKAEVSWNDVVCNQWDVVQDNDIIIDVFKRPSRKSTETYHIGICRVRTSPWLCSAIPANTTDRIDFYVL
jgi:hypothetical protein